MFQCSDEDGEQVHCMNTPMLGSYYCKVHSDQFNADDSFYESNVFKHKHFART